MFNIFIEFSMLIKMCYCVARFCNCFFFNKNSDIHPCIFHQVFMKCLICRWCVIFVNVILQMYFSIVSYLFQESDGILIFDVQKTCFQTNKNISMATCNGNEYCGNNNIAFLTFFTNPITLPEVDCCYVYWQAIGLFPPTCQQQMA